MKSVLCLAGRVWISYLHLLKYELENRAIIIMRHDFYSFSFFFAYTGKSPIVNLIILYNRMANYRRMPSKTSNLNHIYHIKQRPQWIRNVHAAAAIYSVSINCFEICINCIAAVFTRHKAPCIGLVWPISQIYCLKTINRLK